MIACQVAIYPLAATDFDEVILEAIRSIEEYKQDGLSIEVGSMSTILRGPDDLVWKAVRQLFDMSGKNNQIVLNVQMSNECGCDV